MLELLDTVTPGDLPSHPNAIAGYVDGRWPSFDAMHALMPSIPCLSIATSALSRAMVLDVEAGDASFMEAAAWLGLMHGFGMARPVLYTSASRIDSGVKYLASLGIHRDRYRVWSAHWTGIPHICGPACGVRGERPGATQYRGAAAGQHYDRSVSSRAWIAAVVDDFDR